MTEHDGSGEILPGQCRAVSHRGVRCMERARHESEFCFEHRDEDARRVTGHLTGLEFVDHVLSKVRGLRPV